MSEKEIVTLACVMFGRIKPVWKSTREPGAPDNSAHLSWHRHAVEQKS